MSQKDFDLFAKQTRKVLMKGIKKYPKHFTVDAVKDYDALIRETKQVLKDADLLDEWSLSFNFKTPKDLFAFEKTPSIITEEILKLNTTRKRLNESVLVEPVAEIQSQKQLQLQEIEETNIDSANKEMLEEYMAWNFYTPAPPLVEEEQKISINEVINATTAQAIANAIKAAWQVAPNGVARIPNDSMTQIARQFNLDANSVADAVHALGGNVPSAAGTPAGISNWHGIFSASNVPTPFTSATQAATTMAGKTATTAISTGKTVAATQGASTAASGTSGGGILDTLQRLGGTTWAKIKAIWATLSAKIGGAAKAVWAALKTILAKGVAWAVAHPYLVGGAILAALIGAAGAAVLKGRAAKIQKLQTIARYLDRRPHLLKKGKETERDIESASRQAVSRTGTGQSAEPKEETEESVNEALTSALSGLGGVASRASELYGRASSAASGAREKISRFRSAVSGGSEGETARQQAAAGRAQRSAARRTARSTPTDYASLDAEDQTLWDDMTKRGGDMDKTNSSIRSQIFAIDKLSEWYFGKTEDEKGAIDAYTEDRVKSRRTFGRELIDLKKELLAIFGDYREAKKAWDEIKTELRAAGEAGESSAMAAAGMMPGPIGGAARMAKLAAKVGAYAKAIPAIVGAGFRGAAAAVPAAGKQAFGGVQRGIAGVAGTGAIGRTNLKPGLEESSIPTKEQIQSDLLESHLPTEEQMQNGLFA